jgi:putative spermidine/putrescine transport system permease protein
MMRITPFAAPADRVLRLALGVGAGLVLGFLLLPILAIVPLSFNAGSFLTYPLTGLSLRWYRELLQSPDWLLAFRNSIAVAAAVTLLATPLGTFAALGLLRLPPRLRTAATALLLSPLFIPVIVTAVACYFLYAPLGLVNSRTGLVLAHTSLATPFVLVVVHASLQGVDTNLLRAGASLGASPVLVLRRVLLPLIAPGLFAGGVFAFMTSFDEAVVALFLAGPAERTLPLQMLNGVREQISPAITAAATLLVVLSVVLLGTAEALRRRAVRRLATGTGSGEGP